MQRLTIALNGALSTSFTTLQVSMGVVAVALTAAAALYFAYTGRKQEATSATRQFADALFLEGEAQMDAIRQLTLADPAMAQNVRLATALGYTVDDLAQYLRDGTGRFEEFTVLLHAAAGVTGDLDEATGLLGNEFVRQAQRLGLNRDALNKMYFALDAVAQESYFVRNAIAALRDFGAGDADNAAKKYRSFSGSVSKAKQATEQFRDSLKSVGEAARKNLEDARKEFADFAKDVSNSVMSGISFTQAFSEAAGGSFMDALQNQAARVGDFTRLVNELIARGASESVVQQVLGAGTEAGTQIAREILGAAGGVDTANRLVAEAQSLADRVGQNAAGSFRQAGVDTATALVAGIESVISRYRLRLRSRGLSERQLERLRKNFQTEIDFRFTAAGVDIPALADGGVVRRPTVALIGEAGPEAVVPLNRAGSAIGGNTYVTVNVSGGDPQAVVNALVRWSRQNGPLPPQIKVA